MLGRVAIPCQGSFAKVTDLPTFSGYGSGLTSNWSEISRKYRLKSMPRWESSLEGGCPLRAGRRWAPCTSSPWSFTDCLYFVCLRPVGWRFNNPSPDYSGEVEGRWSVDKSAFNVRAIGVWVCLIWRATGSLKDLHTWPDPWRGTQCGGQRRVGLFLASNQIQRSKVDVGRWVKHRLSVNAVRPFVNLLGLLTFHGIGSDYVGN